MQGTATQVGTGIRHILTVTLLDGIHAPVQRMETVSTKDVKKRLPISQGREPKKPALDD
jgi:hypothetical protein